MGEATQPEPPLCDRALCGRAVLRHSHWRPVGPLSNPELDLALNPIVKVAAQCGGTSVGGGGHQSAVGLHSGAGVLASLAPGGKSSSGFSF